MADYIYLFLINNMNRNTYKAFFLSFQSFKDFVSTVNNPQGIFDAIIDAKQFLIKLLKVKNAIFKVKVLVTRYLTFLNYSYYGKYCQKVVHKNGMNLMKLTSKSDLN